MFKEKFKYFKQKLPSPDLSDVIDFRDGEFCRSKVTQRNPFQFDSIYDDVSTFFKPIQEWKIYEIKDRPGLLFVVNPWTAAGQRYWIARCLLDYTKKPNKLNLAVHSEISPVDIEDWWSSANIDEYKYGSEKGLLKKLRWATLGYHHNWDTKVYCEQNKDEFPKDLWLISRFVAAVVGGWNDYNAQAAIINFYHPDCTLSGHRDQSEHNMDAPLLSFSFGLSALFLIGGESLEDNPSAVFIDSGDIIIMSSASRLSYHAVPRIMSQEARKIPCECFSDISTCKVISTIRPDFNLDLLTSVQCDNSCNNTWTDFEKYIKKSRINMNVRQVLYSYENKLP